MHKKFGVLFLLGVLLTVLSGYLALTTWQFQKSALRAVGVVTDLRYSKDSDSSSGVWFPEVTFEDETGQRITFDSSFGSSGYRNMLGKAVGVIYQPGDAQNAKIDDKSGLYIGTIVSGIFALVLMIIGGAGYAIASKGRRSSKLLHEGKPLAAQIISIEQNEALNINGRHPWRIICQWLNTQTNEVHVFKSANLFYDPSPYLQDDNITVYVNKSNMKKYFVDISHLPKEA